MTQRARSWLVLTCLATAALPASSLADGPPKKKAVAPRPLALLPGITEPMVQDWYSKALAAMNEAKLEPGEHEVYRLLWLRTFHRPVVVRVERTGSTASLVYKELDGAGGYEPGKLVVERKVELDAKQWTEVTARLEAAGFWTKASTKRSDGTDGAQWVVEGVRGDRYHLVDRWCVLDDKDERPLAALCRLLLELAGFHDSKDVY